MIHTSSSPEGSAPGEAVIETAASDAAQIAELARQAVGHGTPVVLTNPDGGEADVQGWVLHESQRLHLEATERYQQAPSRARGEATTTEPAAFLAYLHRLGTPATTVWVHQASFTAPPRVCAVLNDHTDAGVCGWRDHRVGLSLTPTPLWAHWVGKDNQLVTQLEFAEHVEDGITAIIRPAAADMLEIAQTFHASRNVNFSSATRVANGEVQLRWHEDTQASAGRNRSMEVPERFTLALEPWAGAGMVYELEARLRYRLREGELRIGYRLDRVDEAMRKAVGDLVDHLTSQLPEHLVLAGQAPLALNPVITPDRSSELRMR